MPSDGARKMKSIEIIDQKVPGQRDMFAPVLSEVPGKWPVAPVGSAPVKVTQWNMDHTERLNCWNML